MKFRSLCLDMFFDFFSDPLENMLLLDAGLGNTNNDLNDIQYLLKRMGNEIEEHNTYRDMITLKIECCIS